MTDLTGPERCMIFRPVTFRTARKTTCAGECDGNCDSQQRCQCGGSKTYCDAVEGCCETCRHDG